MPRPGLIERDDPAGLGRLGRALAAVVALAGLCACNVVLTKTPLFTAADEAGAPRLRPGVWLFANDPKCAVDVSRPLDEWPDCAPGGVVAAGDVAGHKAGTPKGQLEHTPMILAAGDPRIVQLRVDISAGVEASAQASGGAEASASSSSASAQVYGYGAVRPLKVDEQGRIVAFTAWPVLCGPPPPKNAQGEDVALATQQPLPGMEMEKGDAACSTRSIEALRNAAKASLAWADKPLDTARWIRDGAR